MFFVDTRRAAALLVCLAGLQGEARSQSAASSVVRTCPDDRITFGQPLCDPGERRVTDARAPPFTLIAGPILITADCRPSAAQACPSKARSSKPLRFTAYTYNGQLAPPVWKIPRAAEEREASLGAIQFRLINKLPPQREEHAGKPQPTNIHTHGLLVSTRDSEGPKVRYGDNVFLAICPKIDPRRAGESGHDLCLTAAPTHSAQGRHHAGDKAHHGHRIEIGAADYAITVPAYQPPGLNWFHPHAHELSGGQVGAGLSGLIGIGDLCSYPLKPAIRAKLCESRGGMPALRPNVRERFLMLKDLQVAYPARSGGRASAEDYEVATSCLGAARSFGPGWCEFSRHDAGDRKGAAPAAQGLWMFTVNGQVAPVLRMAAGGAEVWRIGNVSPNFTYRLALCKAVPTADPNASNNRPPVWDAADPAYADLTTCERQPFKIISLDGAGAWNDAFHASENELVLMPGSRAEIVVDAPDARRLHLAHLGFRFPDTWPATILARAERGERAPASSGASGAEVAFMPAPPPAHDHASAVPTAAGPRPEGCTDANTIERDGTVTVVFERKQAEDKESKKSEILVLKTWITEIAQNADFRACLDPVQGTNATDGLGSGTPREQCKPFVGVEFQPARKDLCVRKGAAVKFRLINATAEAHNFHLHQAKFDVENFTASAPSSIASPSPAAAEGETARRMSHSPAQHKQVDSVPVLPVQLDDDGTMRRVVEVSLRFDRPHHVGEYVFHCHIIEHEDKGMMNTITVFE